MNANSNVVAIEKSLSEPAPATANDEAQALRAIADVTEGIRVPNIAKQAIAALGVLGDNLETQIADLRRRLEDDRREIIRYLDAELRMFDERAGALLGDLRARNAAVTELVEGYGRKCAAARDHIEAAIVFAA